MTARPAKPDEPRLPKPIVRATSGSLSEGPWTIEFGSGITARVRINREDRSIYPSKRYDWKLRGVGMSAHGHCFSWSSTYLQLWCRASKARPLPGLELSTFELRRQVERVERGDAKETVSVLRELLRRRTGFAWSVRRGRGSSSEFVTVAAVPSRRVRGAMTPHDAALLAGVLGEDLVNPRGVRVEPDGAARASVVRAIAGSPATSITRSA